MMKKSLWFITTFAIFFIGSCSNVYPQAPGIMIQKATSGYEYQAQLLSFGEVMPKGWMLRQMQADLKNGIVGHFPEINNTTEKQRFVLHNAKPDNVPHMADDDNQRGWWSGEHEAYYADGYFRTAWLSGDNFHKQQAIARLEAILKAQTEDGYIGIYSDENRFPLNGPDGELWTQSRIFQALLAYYEATGRKDILEAVEKAVKLTLQHYYNHGYFSRTGVKDGGVSHGIGFSDTLEWLYRITGDDTYKLGFIWLYNDYSKSGTRDLDMTLTNLLDRNIPWIAHTPHTAEGLAMPQIAAAFQDNNDLKLAADNTLYKLKKYSNPGGGMVGDESILGRSGSFNLPSEYCTLTETVGALNRICIYRNPVENTATEERIVFNAAQGARLHPAAQAIAYLTKDNRDIIRSSSHGGREMYSVSHQAAACCALNSTRLLPYYIEGMWMKDMKAKTLWARMYGASHMSTTLGNTRINIDQLTNYPFSDKIVFEVNPATPTEFKLNLVIPEYCKKADCDVPKSMTLTRNADSTFFTIEGTWKKGDRVTLMLDFQIRTVTDTWGCIALAYGPLLFSLPIETQSKTVRTFAQNRFYESEYYPKQEILSKYTLEDNDVRTFHPVKIKTGNNDYPWANPPIGLSGFLHNETGEKVPVILKPLGSTILRQTGFSTTSK